MSALLLALALATTQPDTLYIPQGDSVLAYAVVYDQPPVAEQYKLIGRYAFDTTLVAVELGMKRGKPSGVFRAFHPNGRPLIFAVYGYGSLHGDWTEYDEQGRVIIKGQYRNGLREGTWAFRKEGILAKYHKGERHGRWKYYENKRLVRKEKWRNGKLIKG
jgi:antitoxin component YwqK of YwqJK toxin-antitoxin module